MKTKIAINACGLHFGGAIQVATSFIDELTNLNTSDLDIHIFVSSEVNMNLSKISSPAIHFKNYKIINVHGLSTFFSNLNQELKNFSVTFTIFGPNYLRIQEGTQIVGFAQPWIIDSSAYHILNTKESIKSHIKFLIQKIFFKRADILIVELEHVKKLLENSGILSPKNIEVVHNCISSTYLNPSIWEPIKFPNRTGNFSIGFLSRDYPHKNTKILPEIKKILAEKYNLDVDFFVTLNKFEWDKKDSIFKKNVINIGSVSVAQCPNFYKAMDAVIFPSLLECFSATPLEAMAMKKPLFASDKGFVRDVCGNFAWYFNPLDADSAANIIANYINKYHGKDDQRLNDAREHVLNFSSARGRAEKYLKIIRNTLTKPS